MKTSGGRFPRTLVLDTSAYSHLRAGDERVIDHLVGAQSILMPAIVLGELHAAFRGGRRLEENLRDLSDFMAEPSVRPIEVTAETAVRYGRVLHGLKAAGRPLPTNDIWIAAQSLETGGHLLTFDGDFEHVAGLAVTVLRPVG